MRGLPPEIAFETRSASAPALVTPREEGSRKALAKRCGPHYTVFLSSTNPEMDRQEWIARCSARLHAQWPRVPHEQLDEVAAEIQRKVQRQLEEPERAAVEWLRRGMPDPQIRRDVG